MSTEHEPQFKSNIIAVMADPTNPMHQPALTPGELATASEVVKASVKAQQELDERVRRITDAALASIARTDQMIYPGRIYMAGAHEPGSSFRPTETLMQETPETTFCHHTTQQRIPFTADPLAARYAHGYQED